MDYSDIMIHIDETLDDTTRAALEARMRRQDGVVAPRFNPGRDHLLLVAFDPERTRATELLSVVRTAGHSAQLVGM